jgi:hypothetical protein
MADIDAGQSEKIGSFWRRVPEYWKFLTLLVAIGGTAIAGYAKLDDIRDQLFQADDKINARIDELAADMVRPGDLGGFIEEDKLLIENCRQSLRSQRHEYRALVIAYSELEQAMQLAENAFANRELTGPEERQLEAVIVLRGGYQARRRDLEKEVSALETRIQLTEGC